MTKDDIIRMAQDAGMQTVFAVTEEHKDGWKTVVDHRPFLERFANLVAAAERERCAKIVLTGTGEPVQVATLEILKKERERIAANILEITND